MTTPWLGPDDGRPDARHRLVCLPFAGGGVSAWRGWEDLAPPGVEILKIRLPGREARLSEPAFRSMPALADAAWRALRPVLGDTPWSPFGHSMGGGLAWELARRGVRDGQPPHHLFISSRRAPGLPPPHPPMFALPEADLIQQVTDRYGPLSPVLLSRPAMLRTFLPTLRADMQVIDTWAPDTTPLPVPITAWGGRADPTVPPDALRAWEHLTTRGADVRMVDGGHFHIRDRTDARDQLMAALTRAVETAT